MQLISLSGMLLTTLFITIVLFYMYLDVSIDNGWY